MRKPCNCSMFISTLALVPYLVSANPAFSAALNSAAAAPSQDAKAVPVTARLSYSDGHFTGGTYDAYYGRVQARVNINGGEIISVDILQFPNHTGTSRYINAQALPILKKLVVQAQDVPVNFVSGATLTSLAFLRSINSALVKAEN